jgi:YHS domain-containing protein
MFRCTRRVAIALLIAVALPFAASAEPVRVAMRGYDPVNYFTEGRPEKGSPEFSHVWDGERYLFASAKHREMFASDPARYAPQFPGYCASSLSGGHVVAPNPEYWVIIEGKLYLFGGQQGPGRFKANPGMIQKAEENWPRLRKPAN